MKWLFLLCLPVFYTLKLFACTGILLQAEDSSTVNGRTVEFGLPLKMHVAVIPRNMAFTGKTPLGKGMAYTSKYAAIGIYVFEDPALMDGVNEKGLTAAAFYFPGYAEYAKTTKANRSIALSPVDFTHWILTQFATIEELKAALENVVIAPTVLEGWGDAPPPFHYVVYDLEGKSIVIEPLNGSLKVYENPLGVITNSPTFDWHMTNLNNYINLTAFNVSSSTLGDLSLTAFGQGTGMLGLPGDFTPPSRFVRAAFFSAAALLAQDSDQAVDQVFHILNQFDIPLGTAREKEGDKTSYDFTQLTSVKNPKTGQYFYRSYEDQTIRFVTLSQFDLNAKTIKKIQVQGSQNKDDISSLLK